MREILGQAYSETAASREVKRRRISVKPRNGSALALEKPLSIKRGDPLYLCYWMRQSGLANLLPKLPEMAYVGVSAGSMVMAPCIGEYFVGWKPPTGGDRTLGLVDFAMFPHLDNSSLPGHSLANAEKWAVDMPVPSYLIDDQTAIVVLDGAVEVASEGHWKRFTP